MSKQTADDLRAARKLIERPECWTTRTYWRDQDGKMTSYVEEAAAWSARGAVIAAIPQTLGHFNRSLAAARALAGQLDPPSSNPMEVEFYANRPKTTHADILALFDRAIAAEESAE